MPLHHKSAGDDESESLRSASTRGQLLDEDQVRSVYRFLYCQVGNREEAEELTERACTRVMQAVQEPSTLPRRELTDLLCRITHAVVAEHLQWFYRASHSPTVGDSVALAATVAVRHSAEGGAAECIGHILAQLTARERDMLTYRFLRNASLAETAAQMHLSLADALALQWFALKHAAQVAANKTALHAPPDDPDDSGDTTTR